MTEHIADPVLATPDGGRRMRTPEFYRKRAEMQRQYARDNQALALNYSSAAYTLERRAREAREAADLMDQWADEAEAQRRSDGGVA